MSFFSLVGVDIVRPSVVGLARIGLACWGKNMKYK
jgi:hypothetical protein